MPTLKLTHDEVRLLNDMFSCISDLGLFEGHDENEQDSSPDVFDKLWDKVTQLWSHFYYLITMTKLTLEQHEFDVLKGIIDDRLNSLKKNIAKHSDNLDEYESDIKNYTTYDIHAKLMEVK